MFRRHVSTVQCGRSIRGSTTYQDIHRDTPLLFDNQPEMPYFQSVVKFSLVRRHGAGRSRAASRDTDHDDSAGSYGGNRRDRYTTVPGVGAGAGERRETEAPRAAPYLTSFMSGL